MVAMVNEVCDALRKSEFVIVFKRPTVRGVEIWLAEGLRVHVYEDRFNPYVKGNNGYYVHAVVNCLKDQLGMSPTLYVG